MSQLRRQLLVKWNPIASAEAEEIARWRYPPPYHVYNLGDEALAELLDPDQRYFTAVKPNGELIGFACFGACAQVPGGREAGYYAGDALDLGLGLRPDLTGRGGGFAFVEAAIAFGRKQYHAKSFRLSVATFNRRAIRVYERASFVRIGRFSSAIGQHPVEFLVMRRDLRHGDERKLTECG